MWTAMKNHASAEFCPKFSLGFPVAPAGDAKILDKSGSKPDPDCKNPDTDHHGLPTERPSHFRNQRAHFPNQPRADEGFGEVKPASRHRAEFSLATRQREKNEKRRDAGGRRLCEKFSKKSHANFWWVLLADAERFLRAVGLLEDDAVLQNLFHLKIAHAVAGVDGLAVHNRQRAGGD